MRVPHVPLIPLKPLGLVMSAVYVPWRAVLNPIRVGLKYKLENHEFYQLLSDCMTQDNGYHTKGFAIVLHMAFDVLYIA